MMVSAVDDDSVEILQPWFNVSIVRFMVKYRMLKLGHIIYSNKCPSMPGSSGAVDFPFKLVEGIPTELNRLLMRAVGCFSVVIH